MDVVGERGIHRGQLAGRRRDRRAGARRGLLAVRRVVGLERLGDLGLAGLADEHEALEQLPRQVGVDLEARQAGRSRAQRREHVAVLGRRRQVGEELHELELRVRCRPRPPAPASRGRRPRGGWSHPASRAPRRCGRPAPAASARAGSWSTRSRSRCCRARGRRSRSAATSPSRVESQAEPQTSARASGSSMSARCATAVSKLSSSMRILAYARSSSLSSTRFGLGEPEQLVDLGRPRRRCRARRGGCGRASATGRRRRPLSANS